MRVWTSLSTIAVTFSTISGPFQLSQCQGNESLRHLSRYHFQFLGFTLRHHCCCSLSVHPCPLWLLNLLWYCRFQFHMLALVTMDHCFLQGAWLPWGQSAVSRPPWFSFSLSGPSSSGFFPGSSSCAPPRCVSVPQALFHCRLFCESYLHILPSNSTHSHGVNYPACF